MERLKDKVAIVTGAADGMGEAIVKLFAAEGAQVLGVDLNAEKLKETHGAATNSIKLMDIDVTADDADEMLGRIQNDLFDLGADLATPEGDSPALRITTEQVTRLETEIDDMNGSLEPLKSFILPGGTEAAAWLHLARTVVRRAERRMTELATEEAMNDTAMKYVNRLSDHLFVLARTLNDGGKTDVLWRPGQNAGQK